MPEPAQPRLTDRDPAALLAWAESDPDSYRAAIRAEAEAMVDRALAEYHNRATLWRSRARRAEAALLAAYVLVSLLWIAWAVTT